MMADDLLYGGVACPYDYVDYFVGFDNVLTLVAVATDKDGNIGKIYRQLINLSKDGASPASEYVPQDTPSSVSGFRTGDFGFEFHKRNSGERSPYDLDSK